MAIKAEVLFRCESCGKYFPFIEREAAFIDKEDKLFCPQCYKELFEEGQ